MNQQELQIEHRIVIAEALYLAGFAPEYSSGICDNLIAGYGELNYDFKYPLELDDNNRVVITQYKV